MTPLDRIGMRVDRGWPIRARFTVGEHERRAIAWHYGKRGMATLETCRRFLVAEGTGGLEAVAYAYQTRELD